MKTLYAVQGFITWLDQYDRKQAERYSNNSDTWPVDTEQARFDDMMEAFYAGVQYAKEQSK